MTHMLEPRESVMQTGLNPPLEQLPCIMFQHVGRRVKTEKSWLGFKAGRARKQTCFLSHCSHVGAQIFQMPQLAALHQCPCQVLFRNFQVLVVRNIRGIFLFLNTAYCRLALEGRLQLTTAWNKNEELERMSYERIGVNITMCLLFEFSNSIH